jgi:hypothetical protein
VVAAFHINRDRDGVLLSSGVNMAQIRQAQIIADVEAEVRRFDRDAGL